MRAAIGRYTSHRYIAHQLHRRRSPSQPRRGRRRGDETMTMQVNERFRPIEDTAGLDDAYDRCRAAPVLLFKHDTACPISARAHQELSGVDADIRWIDVERSKDVSAEVERRTGVAHASPQVIVLRDGAAAWSASLHAIDAESVTDAVR
jgi:bacillithiol system protein YtxJ